MADERRGGRWVRRRRVVTPLVVALVVLLGSLAALGVGRDGADDRFVTSSGQDLRVGDEVFRFVGFNLYDAAASDIYSCSPSTRLDDEALGAAMRSISDSGGTVVRFWAYQTYTAGGTDFSGVDRVIDAARSEGLRVLPVLEDGPGNCSTGPGRTRLADADDGTWYSSGYRRPYGDASLSYRAYAATIARHYRDNPTILAWSLVNEAETTQRDDKGRSQLVDFARDVASVVHAADPHHLVTLGTQSNGAPGASGSDFAAIYGQPGIDLTEVHDWAYWGGDTEAMPGSVDEDGTLPPLSQCAPITSQIACSFVMARALDKPIIVGESGMRAKSADARDRRAALMAPKIAAAFDAGASGYLIWQLNLANTDGYGVRIGSNDPVFDTLRTAAQRWRSPR